MKKYGRTPTNAMYKNLAAVYNIKMSKTPKSGEKNDLLKKLKADGLRTGTRRYGSDSLAWIDELLDRQGPEMIVRKSDKAILTRLQANDAVVPADLTANLFKWGAIDPATLGSYSMNRLNASLAEGYGRRAGQSDASERTMREVAGLLAEFLPYLAETPDIYLDGDTLVSKTADRMSNQLAMRSRRRRA